MALKLKFCPECKSKLKYEQREETKQLFLVCPRCGYEEESSETSLREEHRAKEKVTVVDPSEKKIRRMPTTETECPKCGNTTAYTWTVQTRSADEGETQFFRCTECKHTWRLYG